MMPVYMHLFCFWTILLWILYLCIDFQISVFLLPGKKPKAAASKTYQMADRIPEGEVLRDLKKGEWKIGKPIGSGGFGLLYLGMYRCIGTVQLYIKASSNNVHLYNV